MAATPEAILGALGFTPEEWAEAVPDWAQARDEAREQEAAFKALLLERAKTVAAELEQALKHAGADATVTVYFDENPVLCTGAGASWCPACGECTCVTEDRENGLCSPACPLHGTDSLHGRQVDPTGPIC